MGNFDFNEYRKNNKFKISVKEPIGLKVQSTKKTLLKEVKIVGGKFSLNESIKQTSKLVKENSEKERALALEVKKHFLEIISTYKTYQEQMSRASDIVEIAETLGGIVDAAKEMTLREADNWFDKVTIKRNMAELEKLGTQFDKFALEAKAMDDRLHALYEDMGHILNRYYEIADIPTDVMKERLGKKK